MYILAFKEGHDSAACLLKDGEVIAAAEEERFIRKKHAVGVFPAESIKFCLNFANIKEKDVDYVVYARLKSWQTFIKVFCYYFTNIPKTKIELRYFVSHVKLQIIGIFKEIFKKSNYQKIYKVFPNLPKKIYSFDHHLGHAASAYYYSGFQDSLIVTMDGKGEATSVVLAEATNDKIKFLERRGVASSLGLFYSSVTKYLGFTPNDGEYKVMGLAPYGNPDVYFKNILKPDSKKGYTINSDFVLYPLSIKYFEKRFGPAREKDSELKDWHKNFAASAQKTLEESVLSLIKYFLKKNNKKTLCLAGGVALNIKMNKAIWESGLFDKIFIQPVAGDSGLVLGAAALLYKKKSGERVSSLTSLSLGPEYNSKEMKEALKEHNLEYTYLEDPIKETVDLLAGGKVVGWFQGRMEFGPRALGNRSILANPSIEEMKDIVNMKIKFRESFRPFCPSILKEFTNEYFKNYMDSPYMVMSFSTKGDYINKKIPAVVHKDKTVRPQAVDRNINPLYYNLIKSFYNKTGIPVLLNTSMNVRGEPIVCTPSDAIKFFLKTNVDALVIGNYLIKK